MKTNILGINFDNYTINESADIAIKALDSNKTFVIFTPNPEIVQIANKDVNFKNILNSADIVTPDGIGIVYASKILGGNISQRAAGFDIVCAILERLAKLNKSVYLFGGKPGVAELAGQKILTKYSGITVCGTSDGYFDDDAEIINDIKSKKPDLLLVCLGAPKQEKWIYEHKHELNAKILIGAGGSIDVLSGNVQRAPDIYIKYGVEWLYRLKKEPKRFGRMITLPFFLIKVILKRRSNNED